MTNATLLSTDASVQSNFERSGFSVFVNNRMKLGINTVRILLSQGISELVNDDNDPNNINWEGYCFNNAIQLPIVKGKAITLRKGYEAIRDVKLTIIVFPFYLYSILK